MSTPNATQEELPRLLLVEDSETSAALISRYLRGRYDVNHVHNGEEAWKALMIDTTLELVITDIQMPVMNGHELLLKIRASDIARFKNLPVIVMTTADDNTDRNKAFENGANDFVTKPVDPVELQARISVHQKLARLIRELEANRQLLQEQATTDPLTKLKNRRAFFDIGQGHFALARRHGTNLSVLMIDIDHFKRINDTYGHQGGDEVLIGVGQILEHSTRTEDIVARLGGEEFSILLPDTNRLGAVVLAERVRSAIEEEQFNIANLRQISLTISAGVASFGVDGRENLEQLINIADKRLYLAKQSGRNRIVASDADRDKEREKEKK